MHNFPANAHDARVRVQIPDGDSDILCTCKIARSTRRCRCGLPILRSPARLHSSIGGSLTDWHQRSIPRGRQRPIPLYTWVIEDGIYFGARTDLAASLPSTDCRKIAETVGKTFQVSESHTLHVSCCLLERSYTFVFHCQASIDDSISTKLWIPFGAVKQHCKQIQRRRWIGGSVMTTAAVDHFTESTRF